MLLNFTHNSNPICPPNIINRNRCLTQPELDKILHRIQMDYERHSKPLKAKTSNTFVTPPLKTIEFLCFQISLTIPTQIAPQTSLTETDVWLNLNWINFCIGSKWITNDTPSHSKQKLQTLQAKSQTSNKWLDDSSTFPHKQHTGFSTTTPRLTKLTLVAILSLIHIWRCRRIERCRSRWSPYH